MRAYDDGKRGNNVAYLDAIVACRHSSVLDFNVGWGMGKLALCVWSCALIPLELPANLQLKPTGVLNVQ